VIREVELGHDAIVIRPRTNLNLESSFSLFSV
jgi:hypothetical protein